LSPPAPMVLLTRESRSPPVFIFEKPLHYYAEAFSFLLHYLLLLIPIIQLIPSKITQLNIPNH
ncbi:hypothetical protein, partial [Elizabethkingia anophelis]|uniref:hypothetical protein n=1 Tax=Elizabethkingia anophelis TaxID=1117645 RepID=UPI001C89D1B0